jgi:hypothetical protein
LPATSELRIVDKYLDLIKAILRNKLILDQVIDPKKHVRITDDHPYNEYFFIS